MALFTTFGLLSLSGCNGVATPIGLAEKYPDYVSVSSKINRSLVISSAQGQLCASLKGDKERSCNLYWRGKGIDKALDLGPSRCYLRQATYKTPPYLKNIWLQCERYQASLQDEPKVSVGACVADEDFRTNLTSNLNIAQLFSGESMVEGLTIKDQFDPQLSLSLHQSTDYCATHFSDSGT